MHYLLKNCVDRLQKYSFEKNCILPLSPRILLRVTWNFGKIFLTCKRTNGGTCPDSGINRVLKRDRNIILYGCPATGTVSLSVPSLVRLPYYYNVPEILNVQMNEIKKKSNYVCAEFFQKVKTLNFVERKCDFFSEGVNYELNFEEIPHKKFNFFYFVHLNVRNFRHILLYKKLWKKKNDFSKFENPYNPLRA